jgi:Arginase family
LRLSPDADRIAARPASIRENSRLVRRYEPPFHDYDPAARLGLVDCGDVRVRSGYVAEAFENIEAAVSDIVQAGAVPVTMGGDGAVTLPQLRALHRIHRDLVVLRTPILIPTMVRASSPTRRLLPAPRRKASSMQRTRSISARAARSRCPASSNTPAIGGMS